MGDFSKNLKIIHVVWFVCSMSKNIPTNWKHLNDLLDEYEIPIQIVIVRNPNEDPRTKHVQILSFLNY
jgi:hypothetical protein